MINVNGIDYMTQDEAAVALDRSSAWVGLRIKHPDPEERLPVYKGAKTGRGHRNLFLPEDVEALKAKLVVSPQQYIPEDAAATMREARQEYARVPAAIRKARQEYAPQPANTSDNFVDLYKQNYREQDKDRDLLSVGEVAQRLGYTRDYINKRIAAGHIRTVDFSLPGTQRPLHKILYEEFIYILEHGWRDPKKEETS